MRLCAPYCLWMLILWLSGCTSAVNPTEEQAPVDEHLYAISWYYPNDDYQRWVRTQDSLATFIQLYDQPISHLDSILGNVYGLILTGGSDISPGRFGQVDSQALCGKIDPKRDSIELRSFEIALELKLPTLGVCRGMQMINVGLGGDLMLDIPTSIGSELHQRPDTDAVHMVYAEERLASILSVDSGLTNSNHHQAIDRLADGLEIIAWTKDSIIESIHLPDTVRHPFLWGVQWHPERMERTSAMASPLLRSFLNACQQSN